VRSCGLARSFERVGIHIGRGGVDDGVAHAVGMAMSPYSSRVRHMAATSPPRVDASVCWFIPRVNHDPWTTLARNAIRWPCRSSRAQSFLHCSKNYALIGVAVKLASCLGEHRKAGHLTAVQTYTPRGTTVAPNAKRPGLSAGSTAVQIRPCWLTLTTPADLPWLFPEGALCGTEIINRMALPLKIITFHHISW
jgi:hypothetical protein